MWLTETIKAKGADFLIITLLLGGLLVAGTTAYQASVANQHLKDDLVGHKQAVVDALGQFKEAYEKAHGKQDASVSEVRDSVTEVKKALLVVMSKLGTSVDDMKELVGEKEESTSVSNARYANTKYEGARRGDAKQVHYGPYSEIDAAMIEWQSLGTNEKYVKSILQDYKDYKIKREALGLTASSWKERREKMARMLYNRSKEFLAEGEKSMAREFIEIAISLDSNYQPAKELFAQMNSEGEPSRD